MGVPTLFKNIVKKYKNVYYWKNNERIDHLFIDYNGILHNVIQKYIEENIDILEGKTNTTKEKMFIEAIINETLRIAKRINPTKLLYLALDGVVPMGKMHQSRSRRYKATLGVKKSSIWDKSVNLSPQTKFMKKFSKEMTKAIKSRIFGKLNVVFSDTSEIGEGEHKIIAYIRKNLSKNSQNNKKENKKSNKKENKKSNNKFIKIKIMNNTNNTNNGDNEIKENIDGGGHNDTLCIMSPDADMLVLSFLFFNDKNVLALRMYEPDKLKLEGIDDETEYVYVSIREYQMALFKEWNLDLIRFNEDRIVRDHLLLTFLSGNDTVRSLPFMKMKKKVNRKDAQEYIFDVYKKVLYEDGEYLTTKNDTINLTFLEKMMEYMSKIEQSLGKNTQRFIDDYNRENSQHVSRNLKEEKARELSEDEIMANRQEHNYYYSPLHPEYEKYKHLFIGKNRIDYYRNDWKERYYRHFVGTHDPKYINNIVFEYIKSLEYTFQYYINSEPPSWQWYYFFRVAPFPSDISYYLSSGKNNKPITFIKGSPFSSEQLLAMILPPQKLDLLSKKNKKIVEEELFEYYPTGFELDVVDGEKSMYSEAILPHFNFEDVISKIS